MKGRFLLQLIILFCIFVITLVLEITPWPAGFQGLRPAWLVLVLSFWILALPTKVNVGTAFLLGLIWDVVLGSILGIHALVLSCFAYFIAKYYQKITNLSLTQQSLFIVLLVLAVRTSVFLLEFFIHGATFNSQEILGALISGLLWPWLFLLLRKIQHQLGLG